PAAGRRGPRTVPLRAAARPVTAALQVPPGPRGRAIVERADGDHAAAPATGRLASGGAGPGALASGAPAAAWLRPGPGAGPAAGTGIAPAVVEGAAAAHAPHQRAVQPRRRRAPRQPARCL